MSLTAEQYLALSQIAYHHFDWPDSQGKTIAWLLENNTIEGEGQDVLAALSEISDWKLVKYSSEAGAAGAGFAGLAFESSDESEVAMAFRGTEANPWGVASGEMDIFDIATDIEIMKGNLTTQFSLAYAFYNSIATPNDGVEYTVSDSHIGNMRRNFLATLFT